MLDRCATPNQNVVPVAGRTRRGSHGAPGHARPGGRLAIAAALGLLVALGGASLRAHDMWIDPTSFHPQAGAIVGLRLRVGQDLLGDPIPRDPSLINQFIVEDMAGRKPVVGRDGADPAGYVRAVAPGLAIAGYHSKPSRVELTADKFNQYLEEEGLDEVAAARARQHLTNAPVRELFSRCAKSLVLTGAPIDGQGDRVLGFPLELVAERSPYAMTAGQDLSFRLTYDNRPLPGALVVAINKMNPSEKPSARTDAHGRVTLRLPHQGMWMIKAVHMVPAPAGSNADWASYWASLTFDLRGRI